MSLQAAEKKATELLTEFEGLARTCKFRSRQLRQCRIEADESLQTVSDEHQAKIDAAAIDLKAAHKAYDDKLKELDGLKQKIAANEKEAKEWDRKYADARENNPSKADYYREMRDLASQTAKDFRLALNAHVITIDAEFGGSLRAAQLRLQQAIENRQMAMEFTQDDAMKKVRACLYADAGQATPTGGSSTPEKEASVLDELLAHTVKVQGEALAAMEAVTIRYSDNKCGKKKPAAVSEAAPPAPPAPGIAIDPALAGLYTTSGGEMLVRLSVDGSTMRGEVVEVCEPMQQPLGLNYHAGDPYLEGAGRTPDTIGGRLHIKLISRLSTPEGSRPLACKWQESRDQWVEAEFYQQATRGNMQAIHGRYTMPLSLIECGNSARSIDGLLLSRPQKESTGFMSIENSFRRNCDGFAANSAAGNMEIEMGRPPEMPEIPVVEEPLLLPEPPLLLPEPPR